MRPLDLIRLRGGKSVPFIRQTEISECGLACLAMVAGYHGLVVDPPSLRRRFAVGPRGTPLKILMHAAEQLGLVPRAIKTTIELLGEARLPAILHWDLSHYVVLVKTKKNKYLIHDPGLGKRVLSREEISAKFTGVVLELSPAADFQPAKQAGKMDIKLWQLWSHISGLKRSIIQVLVLTLVLQAFVLTSPFYMQVALDTVLPSLDVDFLVVLAIGFGLFTLINAGATLLRHQVLLSVGSLISFQIAVNVGRRLFRLPLTYFERRHIGDVLSRFGSIEPIREALTKGLVAALVDGVFVIFTLIIMLFYSMTLAAIALVTVLVYAAVRLVLFQEMRHRTEEVIVTRGQEESTMIESLRGIVTLRLFAREAERHWMWQTRLADAVNADIRAGRLQLSQDALNVLLFGLENVVSIYLAVRLAIDGGFSVGMVFAYMSYKQQFVRSVTALIEEAITFRMLGLHLERLSDIALEPEDPTFQQPDATYADREVQGSLEVCDLRFRYAEGEPYVLQGASIAVEKGEYIAITGPSGAGKTTFLKLLLGLMPPDEGEILVDGVPIARFGLMRYRESAAAVLQDDQLFAGSLAQNISFFDAEADPSRIEECARLAAIHDDIMQMPMRYETLVGDTSSTLSGGQKQRVLLARALYKRPKILLMDEGTAHLDAMTEAAVNRSVGALGITRIIIAHRLETIRSADKIYLLSEGHFHPGDSTGAQLVTENQSHIKTLRRPHP